MRCPHRELDAALAAPADPTTLPTLVWITGLSGVGKSTLAAALLERLRADGVAASWLDGDALRARLGAVGVDDFGAAARRRLALRYAALAAELAGRGRIVVVSTISLFHAVHASNRTAPLRYLEVLLRAPEPLRRQRSGDRAGGPRVGGELAAEYPPRPDLVLDNDDDPHRIACLVERVVERLRA